MIAFPKLSRIRELASLFATTAIILVGLGASESRAQGTRVSDKTPANNTFLMTGRVLKFPLEIDRASIPKMKEVCLYSKEGAGNWKCLARVAPDTTYITIKFPHDGEYAMQLVTVDHMGRSFPTDLNKATPSMTLVVDTRVVDTRVVDTRPNTAEPVGANPSAQEPPIAPPPANTKDGPVSSTSQEITTTSSASPMATTATLPTAPGSAPPPDAKVNDDIRSRRRHYLKSPRVDLDYIINKSGPSGISKIDVYITSDRDASWKRLATINNPRNHSEVELPGEGIFGIRLVATNGNGFGGKIPGPGDLPSALFEVDLTGPELKVDIAPVKNATLDISWQVSDKNLSPEPIQIFYAVQAGSPSWQLVAKVPNDGVYHWLLPRDMPENFLIRVEARDLAGNVSHADCPNPVPLDLTEPDVTLVGPRAVPPTDIVPATQVAYQPAPANPAAPPASVLSETLPAPSQKEALPSQSSAPAPFPHRAQ